MDLLTKPVGNLTNSDFFRYPVWGWHQNDPDTSMVCPVILEGNVIEDSDYDPVFILCDIRLSDGTMYKGDVALNIRSKQPYSLVFYKNEHRFMFSGSMIPGIGGTNELSQWLQKHITRISPITFTTQYLYKNGVVVKGEIDLQQW